MPNTMRWRYGETNPVALPAPAGTIVEIGDLVYLDAGYVKPAASLTDLGTLMANQQTFHDSFVGVAMQCASGETEEIIRVATSGVFELTCSPAAFEVGDLIGGQENGTGNQLESQRVVGVATENLALGRCVKQAPAGSEKVLVDVVSTVVRGGPQAAAT